MWTRPTLPPSRVRNAPYGVILETVPSTTAPTSRSASFSSSESSVPEQARLGHYPIASFPTSTAVGGGWGLGVDRARVVARCRRSRRCRRCSAGSPTRRRRPGCGRARAGVGSCAGGKWEGEGGVVLLRNPWVAGHASGLIIPEKVARRDDER